MSGGGEKLVLQRGVAQKNVFVLVTFNCSSKEVFVPQRCPFGRFSVFIVMVSRLQKTTTHNNNETFVVRHLNDNN